MSFYIEMAGMANEMLTEFGQSVTIQRPNGNAPFNPNTGAIGSPTEYAISSAFWWGTYFDIQLPVGHPFVIGDVIDIVTDDDTFTVTITNVVDRNVHFADDLSAYLVALITQGLVSYAVFIDTGTFVGLKLPMNRGGLKGLTEDYHQDFVRGKLGMLLLSAKDVDFQPRAGDNAVIAGQNYEVIGNNVLSPAGTDVLYKVPIRSQ